MLVPLMFRLFSTDVSSNLFMLDCAGLRLFCSKKVTCVWGCMCTYTCMLICVCASMCICVCTQTVPLAHPVYMYFWSNYLSCIYTYIYIYSQKTRGLSVNFSCLHINPPPIQLLRTEHKISNKRLKRLESHFTAELHHYIHGLSFNLLYVVWLNCC